MSDFDNQQCATINTQDFNGEIANQPSVIGMPNTNSRQSLSLLAGWEFISLKEGSEDSLPITTVIGEYGPTIQYNPNVRTVEYLENPNHALDWLSLLIKDFCAQVIKSACQDKENFVGQLDGEGWDQFRAIIENQSGSTIKQIARMVSSNGFDVVLDDIVDCVYIESGLHSALIDRSMGKPSLSIVKSSNA